MSKKDEFSNLTGQLARKASGGVRAPSTQALVGSLPSQPKSTTLHAPKNDGFKSESLTSPGLKNAGIRFGAPSQRATTAASTNPLTHLLSSTLSGGISNAFGGGGSLLSITGGFGRLISGLVGLFSGGKKTPPPLQLFTLPSVQNEDISVSPQSLSGPVFSTAARNQNPGAVSGGPASHGEAYQAQSVDVASAVKLALLNSNSLSDVIAEL